MFCRLFDQLFECCRIPNENGFNTELEFEFYETKNATQCQGMLNCIHASGSCLGNILNYNSFRPNTSIRYSTSNLHQRYGTNQLSLLPKYDASQFERVDTNHFNDLDNEIARNLLNNGPEISYELLNFIKLLSKGIMVKQVIDLTIGDTKYIAIYLSKNLNSLILDNFGGVLLEVPLKFIIDIIFSDFSNNKKTLISEFTIRKGYEPIKLNEDVQYLVSIDLGMQMKSICLTFSSEVDGMSFCTNLSKLVNYLNFKRIGRV